MGSSGSKGSADTKAFIDNEISGHQVVIFSKSYCPYCKATKDKLSSDFPSADVKVFELDQMGDGPAIQNTLATMTGQRTVPNVFVKGTHLGGNDDTQAAIRSGKFAEMLA